MTARALRAPALDASAVAVPPSIAEAFAGQVVVITPITDPAEMVAAHKDSAIAHWNERTGEGFVIQPLYTERDREWKRVAEVVKIEERKTS
jgi:hypothetical protein